MNLKTRVRALTAIAMILWPAGAWAGPGLIELAVRSGFWTNQYPDKAIMLQHIYYNAFDQVRDDDGDEIDVAKTRLTANFTRLIRPWHFGDEKQYQVVLEAIVTYANLSFEKTVESPAGHVSGMMDPLLYTSVGWNNHEKTTHVQGAVITRAPLGNTDLTTDAWAFQPILALHQKLPKVFQFDGSLSYQLEADTLDGARNRGKDYLELNGIVASVFGPTDVFVQGDYTKYEETRSGGVGNGDSGFNTLLAVGVNYYFRPNMQIGLKLEKDLTGKNTSASHGFNLRYLWIF